MNDPITILGILIGYIVIAYIHWQWGYGVAVEDAIRIVKELKNKKDEEKEILLRETLGEEGKTTCL